MSGRAGSERDRPSSIGSLGLRCLLHITGLNALLYLGSLETLSFEPLEVTAIAIGEIAGIPITVPELVAVPVVLLLEEVTLVESGVSQTLREVAE